jgi:hypothetical protein
MRRQDGMGMGMCIGWIELRSWAGRMIAVPSKSNVHETDSVLNKSIWSRRGPSQKIQNHSKNKMRPQKTGVPPKPKMAVDAPPAGEEDDKYHKVRRNSKWLPVIVVLTVLVAVGFALQRSKSSSSLKSSRSTTTTSNNNNNNKTPDLAFLEQDYRRLDEKVREIKATGVIMETDANSLTWTSQLQTMARQLIQAKYGVHDHYRVQVDLVFQPSIPDYKTNGPTGRLIIEMAPIEYIPVSVYTFLEIARSWEKGAFHRNAGHVLQATTQASAITKHLPFQEYSEHFPHKKGTCGYCGRPSGPCWYISIMDNTLNHGPGTQQQKNPYEADANFGTIVAGMDDVVPRIHNTPQTSWLDKENQIIIQTMTVLVPTGPNGAFQEWRSGNAVVEVQ